MPAPIETKGRTLPFLGKPVFFGWYLVFATLFISTVVSGFFNFGMSAFIIPLEDSLGTNREVISTALGIAPIESALLGPLLGLFVDKYGARRFMVVGTFLLTAGFVLMGYSHSIWQFVLYYVMMAVGNGMITAPALAAISNWFIKRRGLAYAIAPMGFGFGGALVPFVAYLINAFGWQTAAWICGLCIFVTTIPLVPAFRYRPEPYGLYPDGEKTPPVAYKPGEKITSSTEINFTIKEALREPAFWLANLNFATRVFVVGALSVQFIPAMVSKGYSTQAGASIVALLGVFMIPGRFGFGFLADRFNKRLVMAAGSTLLALSMVGFYFAHSYWMILLVFAVYASANGGSGSAVFAIRGEYFGRASTASIVGFGSILQSLGGFFGNRVAGTLFVHTGSYGPVFLVYGAVSFVGAFLILLAKRPVPKRLRVPLQAAKS